MNTNYKGFKISIGFDTYDDEYIVTTIDPEGNWIDSDNYDNEEDAMSHGKKIVDEFLLDVS